MQRDLADALTAASNAPGTGLDLAALVIARIEYPRLESEPYLAKLDLMGEAARRQIERHIEETRDRSALSRLDGFNAYLFKDQRFVINNEDCWRFRVAHRCISPFRGSEELIYSNNLLGRDLRRCQCGLRPFEPDAASASSRGWP